MTKIQFKFKLSQIIDKTDFLKFVFPFPLHSKLTAAANGPGGFSKPKQLIVSY